VGLATAAFLLFYQWVIEPAAPNSLRVKAWARLTNVRFAVARVLTAVHWVDWVWCLPVRSIMVWVALLRDRSQAICLLPAW
jgi:hypothetical protein